MHATLIIVVIFITFLVILLNFWIKIRGFRRPQVGGLRRLSRLLITLNHIIIILPLISFMTIFELR